MTRQEFADKWGYQSGVGYGCAQFDCRESLLKDLNVLIADEVKNLALPQVSVVHDPVVLGAVCSQFETCLNGGKNKYCDLQTFKELDCFVGQTER